MTFTSRNCRVLIILALVMAVFACGCTSSGTTNSGSSDPGTASPGSDSPGFSSGFAEVQGTYISVDNPAMYITLNRDGTAEIETGSGKITTSFYMEAPELKLADGTRIGDYPVPDGTLVYRGMTFRK